MDCSSLANININANGFNENYHKYKETHLPPIKTKKYKNYYETSGIKKFVEPSSNDIKFFDKIFAKNKNWNFFLDSFSIDNDRSGYTRPVKTTAVYIHDEKELNQQDLDLLKSEFHSEKDLLNFLSEKELQIKIISKNDDMHEIKKDEFFILRSICQEIEPNKGFINIYEFDTMRQRFAGRNLKLLAWITIPLETKYYFDLTKLVHFGRHLIVKPINAHTVGSGINIDFKSIHFFGGVVRV